MRSLAGHVAVVTGASSGVGKAIALALAGQGATSCLVGRKLERLEAVAASVQANSSAPRCYQADLTRDEDMQRLVGSLQRDFDSVDVLVHSAGAITMDRIEQARAEDFDEQYRTNVRAPALLTQALLPMLRAHKGQVVFINSSVGLNARAGVGQYAATKHGLKAIADSLREEVNVDGVRVLSVFLGRTASPMQEAVHAAEGKPYRPDRLIQPEDVAAVVVNVLALPPTAEVTEISMRPLAKS